jgi:hypothetical protein
MIARWVAKKFWQLNHRPKIAHAFKMHIYSLKEKISPSSEHGNVNSPLPSLKLIDLDCTIRRCFS